MRTRQHIEGAVRASFNDIIHNLDLEPPFIGDERPEWQAARKLVCDLAEAAYRRGHTCDD